MRVLWLYSMDRKTIIITGVSSGLGKALLDTLRTADVRLVCISHTFLDYQTALKNENVALLKCDLSNLEEVYVLTEKLGDMLLSASDIVFINNAATVSPIGRIGEIGDAEIIASAHTNFVSSMLITNALCRLKKAERLTFIHISTGAARTPIVGWPLYCSTKAASKMFFAILQEQYKGDERVVVHEFDPGVMDTPMQAQIRQAPNKDFPRVEEFKKLQQMHTLSDPSATAKKLVEQYIHV